MKGKISKIALISLYQSGYQGRLNEFIFSRATPPLGILSLAAYLKRQNPSLHLLILDHSIATLEDIQGQLSEFKPEIIGISTNGVAYKNTLQIAKLAKCWNSKIILGGHYATGFANEILQNRGPFSKDYCVDAVIQQDGEKSFYDVISGKSFFEINNLIFQTKTGIKFNPVRLLNLNSMPSAADLFKLINIRNYYDHQKRDHSSGLKVLTLYSRKGCIWREVNKKGCIFCSIMWKKNRVKNPFVFRKEVEQVQSQYRPDIIFDVSDSFLDDHQWLNDFSNNFSSLNSPSLSFYAKASQINKISVKFLKKIGTRIVFLGLDSGDNRMLLNLNKGCSSEANKKAVNILLSAGICVKAGFVLGAPGETYRSLSNTLEFAKSIKNKFIYFSPNILNPIPGSLAYTLLMRAVGDKYRKDLYSNEELVKDWVKHFCHVSHQEILNFCREIQGLNEN